jgi:hypothetical protein
MTPIAMNGGTRRTAMVKPNKKFVPISQNLSMAGEEEETVAKPKYIMKLIRPKGSMKQSTNQRTTAHFQRN